MATVVDLDDIVEQWAKTVDSYAKNVATGISYDIDWSHVSVETKTPNYNLAAANETIPQSMVLFKSRFDNNSSEVHEHRFSAKSKHTSFSSVTLHQCFTLDGRTQIDLSLPEDVLKTTSGFGQTLSLSASGTQTFYKEQTWNVDTKIVVPEHASRTAEQSIRETEYSAPFSVNTFLSGKVFVKKLDKNGSFVGQIQPKYISEIVQGHYAHLLPPFVQIEGRSVRITSRGECKFTYAIEQHVTVSNN